MIRLGVNIDHVATLRNARGETYPSPIQAAALAELGGADNITCHLREDRRHIRDGDVTLLASTIQVPLNFEIASTDEMVGIACQLKPHAVTLVPEKRQELTTEGGLDLSGEARQLGLHVKRLADSGIFVSLFVEPENKAMELAQKLGAKAVEIHTGHLCRALRKATSTRQCLELLKPIQEAAELAAAKGLQVHVGHGINYSNAAWIQLLPHCEEANIGHAIVARAVFVGLAQAVKEMKALINDPQFRPYAGG